MVDREVPVRSDVLKNVAPVGHVCQIRWASGLAIVARTVIDSPERGDNDGRNSQGQEDRAC